MPDDRKPHDPGRSPPAVIPPATGAGRPGPPDEGRRASGAAIKAVSELLASKKPALDRPAAPASIRLPDFPGTPEATARRLETGPASRVKSGTPETSIPPPAVTLPEGPKAEASKADQRPSADVPRPGPLAEARPTSGMGPTAATPAPAGDVPRPTLAVAMDGIDAAAGLAGPGRRPEGRGAADSQLVTPNRNLFQGDIGANSPASGDATRRSDGGMGVNLAGPAGSARVDRPTGASAASGLASGGKPGPLGDARSWDVVTGGSRQDGGAARTSTPPGYAGDSKAGPVAGPMGVRASLAIGPRDLSRPRSGLSGDSGGTAPDFGGFGFNSGGDAPGPSGSSGSAAPPVGGPIDLSKTNELLQQLLEAVRGQRETTLPAGGSSVYSGR